MLYSYGQQMIQYKTTPNKNNQIKPADRINNNKNNNLASIRNLHRKQYIDKRIELYNKQKQGSQQIKTTQDEPKQLVSSITKRRMAQNIRKWLGGQEGKGSKRGKIGNIGCRDVFGVQMLADIQQVHSSYMFKQHPRIGYCYINAEIHESQYKNNVKMKVCGLLNHYGGYLFIANGKKQQCYGLYFQSKKQCVFNQRKLQSMIKQSIYPQQFNLSIQMLPFNKEIEDNKYVIRAMLSPIKRGSLYFVKDQLLNGQASYIPYFLDYQTHDQDKIYQLQNIKDIYRIIHENFSISSKVEVPIAGFSSINECNIQENIHMSHKGCNFKMKLAIDQQIKNSYKNQCILILSNKSEDKNVSQFKKCIQKQFGMVRYEICKPHESYHRNSSKAIYFISHEYQLTVLQKIVKQAFSKNKAYLITCSRYLLVQNKQQKDLSSFYSIFKDIFRTSPDVAKLDSQKSFQGAKLYKFYMRFRNCEQAVFSFIYLQNSRIRSQFSKQSQFEMAKQCQKNFTKASKLDMV